MSRSIRADVRGTIPPAADFHDARGGMGSSRTLTRAPIQLGNFI